MYRDNNGDGKISGNEIYESGPGPVDVAEYDFVIGAYTWRGLYDLSGGALKFYVSNPQGEEILSGVGSNEMVFTTNHYKIWGHHATSGNINYIAKEVIKNPGRYIFTARGTRDNKSVKKQINLQCFDPTKIHGRTGLGEVESVNEE